MNLLILESTELDANSIFWVDGRRHDHLKKILKVKVGNQIRAGILQSSMGLADVLAIEKNRTQLSFSADKSLLPPETLNSRLILALPRPPVLRRVLLSATTLGFKDIHLIHAARVEKSYWQSPELEETKILSHLVLGLEQAVDIRLPRVQLHKRFRPFAEDILPELQADRPSYLADPASPDACPSLKNSAKCNLLIGPEGGWVPFELELLEQTGVEFVRLGPRILKVETALPYMVGCLHLGNS